MEFLYHSDITDSAKVTSIAEGHQYNIDIETFYRSSIGCQNMPLFDTLNNSLINQNVWGRHKT